MIDHIFELVQNSISAGSKNIQVIVKEDRPTNLLKLTIIDDGFGIKPAFLSQIQNAFFTTRPHGKRRIGLGLSMMAATCEQAGGELIIDSTYRHGTTVTAVLEHDHIDRPPLGDLADLYASLMVSNHENKILWKLEHIFNGESYTLRNRKTLDELNHFSFGEKGVKETLYKLIHKKEKSLHF